MPHLLRPPIGAFALLLTLAAAGCGRGEPEPDNAAIDYTLNQLIANDEAEKQQLVEEARAREDVRENEMEQREDNYTETPD